MAPRDGIWIIKVNIDIGPGDRDYKISDGFKMAAQKNLPKDAQVMMAILKEMGITEYEPRVINQMLEFSYRMHYFILSIMAA